MALWAFQGAQGVYGCMIAIDIMRKRLVEEHHGHMGVFGGFAAVCELKNLESNFLVYSKILGNQK
jgi:hypothetical protein